ncbi:hypothetical protein POM88_031052 [Heracleum sosnowskyi]|uniref:Uncharacterized protein n=1 Tax=Heracleum sosnowskyi TaxID=360622 RepID=A0AAD8HWN7_9APIA|nr:hypothetical protein POM88_031052 [Heracleum sosnowskyi]
MQNDVSSLLSQLKDMQHKNSELADENNTLWNVSLFSIMKALKDVAMGKDAAVVAKAYASREGGGNTFEKIEEAIDHVNDQLLKMNPTITGSSLHIDHKSYLCHFDVWHFRPL